jgi:hypothetical protein
MSVLTINIVVFLAHKYTIIRSNPGKLVPSQPVKLISNPTVATLHLLYSHACVPEMALYAFPPRTDDVNTPFEEGIKSLIRIVFVGIPISPNEGFQLSKELLNRI